MQGRQEEAAEARLPVVVGLTGGAARQRKGEEEAAPRGSTRERDVRERTTEESSRPGLRWSRWLHTWIVWY
jgi:hypothetical protein